MVNNRGTQHKLSEARVIKHLSVQLAAFLARIDPEKLANVTV